MTQKVAQESKTSCRVAWEFSTRVSAAVRGLHHTFALASFHRLIAMRGTTRNDLLITSARKAWAARPMSGAVPVAGGPTKGQWIEESLKKAPQTLPLFYIPVPQLVINSILFQWILRLLL
jgi:hypothetical protein